MLFMSEQIGYFLNKVVGILPANTGISYGFPVDAFADFLASAFQIGFNHKSLYHRTDIRAMPAGVEHILADPGLLIIFLTRVGVVGIHDQRNPFAL